MSMLPNETFNVGKMLLIEPCYESIKGRVPRLQQHGQRFGKTERGVALQRKTDKLGGRSVEKVAWFVRLKYSSRSIDLSQRHSIRARGFGHFCGHLSRSGQFSGRTEPEQNKLPDRCARRPDRPISIGAPELQPQG